jgi:hypothetical protein
MSYHGYYWTLATLPSNGADGTLVVEWKKKEQQKQISGEGGMDWFWGVEVFREGRLDFWSSNVSIE